MSGGGKFRSGIGLDGGSAQTAGRLMAEFPANWRVSRTRVVGGRHSPPTRKRSTRWSARSERALASALGSRWELHWTSRRLSLAEVDDTSRRSRGQELDSGEMIAMLSGWISRYPILSIEDPLAEDDAEGFAEFTRRHGKSLQIVGDDFLVSDAARVKQAAEGGAANTVLLKPNQRGTLSETFDAWNAAKDTGFAAIVSARSGETEDTTIVHLAVGWEVGQLKVGSFTRSERMAKWNEMLRNEEALGSRARFAGGAALGRNPP